VRILLDDRIGSGTDAGQLGELLGHEHFVQRAVLDEVGEVRLRASASPIVLRSRACRPTCEERQFEERVGHRRHRLQGRAAELGRSSGYRRGLTHLHELSLHDVLLPE
jgi:hypothetical protein